MPDRELETDILIVGGGTGAVAAALAIARSGRRCIISEPTDWVGGQLTSQAIPPDENRWIEGLDGVQGATASYLDFRRRVRAWYREHRDLNAVAKDDPRLNPGNGWVSHLCCEPRVAHAVLVEMLAPYVASGRVTILLHHEPASADGGGDRLNSVTLLDLIHNRQTTVSAEYFLDATELGDLFPLAKIEYHIGAEHKSVFNELHGRSDKSEPSEHQAISWCFALEHHPGENNSIDKPARYDFFKSFIPPLDHPWPGPLFSWTICGGADNSPRTFEFVPWPDKPKAGMHDMWRYRRIVDNSIYVPSPSAPPDVSLINMVQMDYFLNPILDVTPAQQQAALHDARQQSLSFLYWMQTQSPRHDGKGAGYPGLKLRGEELGTSDGFAKAVYVRESRRLAARKMITEGDVGTDQRKAEGKSSDSRGRKSAVLPSVPEGTSEPFADSVGIGHYRLDLHPSTAMRNSLYVQTAPFRIPMGALIPKRVRNVLAAAKNLGVTHITNGCYRLHPVEWNTGESAGFLAAYCLEKNREPQQVHESLNEVREFQKFIKQQGVAISWPWENGAGLM
jgi:hypothetical protein